MSITSEQRSSVLDDVPTQLFIGGEWRDATGGGTLAVEDPSTGETLAEVADATPEDAMAALDAAVDAQAEWAAHAAARARRDPAPRLRAAHRARRRPRAADDARDGQAARRVEGRDRLRRRVLPLVRRGGGADRRPLRDRAQRRRAGCSTMQQPVGPCYSITPWNFPMAMGTRKIGPAIAAGCTMVVKPAQQTPLSMLALAQDPRGGRAARAACSTSSPSSSSSDVSKPLIGDPRLRKLSFTGSTEVGRKLIEQAAEQLLRVSMELGGNAPFLVFDDADLDAAVEGAMIAKMRNIGEACTAANRFHVAEPVADEFAEKLAAQAGRAEGRARHRGRRQGRPADRRRRSATRSPSWSTTRSARAPQVRASAAPRATAPATSTSRPCSADVPDDARLLKEEIFGPVAPVVVVRRRGRGDRGRQRHRVRPRRLRLHARPQARVPRLRGARDRHGRPQPGHGLQRRRRRSAASSSPGFGREGGAEGIEEYLETKYVAMDL